MAHTILRFLITSSISLVLSGCSWSLNQAWTPETLVENDMLIGTWSSAEGASPVRVIKKSNNEYRIMFHLEDNDSIQASMHIFQLGDSTFIDLQRESNPGTNQAGILKPHIIYKLVQSNNDRIELYGMRPFQNQIQAKEMGINLMKIDGCAYIAMESAHLQKAIREHGDSIFQLTPIVFDRSP